MAVFSHYKMKELKREATQNQRTHIFKTENRTRKTGRRQAVKMKKNDTILKRTDSEKPKKETIEE